jgi:hypothetical protein
LQAVFRILWVSTLHCLKGNSFGTSLQTIVSYMSTWHVREEWKTDVKTHFYGRSWLLSTVDWL